MEGTTFSCEPHGLPALAACAACGVGLCAKCDQEERETLQKCRRCLTPALPPRTSRLRRALVISMLPACAMGSVATLILIAALLTHDLR